MATDTQFVRGAERLAQRIATIRARCALPPLVDEIGGLLLDRTRKRFLAEVDPDNVPWKPLAEVTLRRKAQEGYGAEQKLVRKGAMRDAIKLIRGRVDGGMFTNTGAGVRIGITDPDIAKYGLVQNRGSRNVPRRRFLGIGRLDVKAVDSKLRRLAAQLERDL